MTATHELQLHLRLDVQIEIQLQLLATDVIHTLDLMLTAIKKPWYETAFVAATTAEKTNNANSREINHVH